MTVNRDCINIIAERCTGCGLCVKACPFGAIRLCNGIAVIDYDACTVCGACVSVCRKFNAVTFAGESMARSVRSDDKGDVWVVCETDGSGCLDIVSRELLGTARRLATSMCVRVGAVLIGHNVETAACEAGWFGADYVSVASAPELAVFRDEPYAEIIAGCIHRHAPSIVLGGATAVGRALLPRIAVMVNTGLTADCTELDIDAETGLLRQTRPAFGGNILATIVCEKQRPQMATVRPGVMPCPEPDRTRSAVVNAIPIKTADLYSAIDWLSFIPKARNGVDLSGAEIVVTAGYGVGGPQGVEMVAQLARCLGGALGATRAVVDAGWLEYAHQVGQTGTTVQPQLYIACGVSGAIQHIVGMQSSGTVIAINKNPDAPIFDFADVAVAGDIMDILPPLIEYLEHAKRSDYA